VLRRNPQYFEFENGQRLPHLEAVNVDFIKNKQIAFMRFVAGEYDFFNGLEGSFKDELLDNNANLKVQYRSKFKMLKKPFLNTEYLGFWLGGGKSSDAMYQIPAFRRALSLAINRQEIIKYLRNGLGDPGEAGFVPPVLCRQPVKGFVYDPQAAALELQKAGYPGGNGCPEIRLTVTADYLDVAVYVQKYWQALGLKVKIDVQTGGMLRQMRNKGELPAFRGSWYADYGDPENFLACFYSKNFSPGGPNYTHYSNPEFDKLYEGILLATDETERQILTHKADSLLIGDAPVIVLYYDKSLRLFQNHVKNLYNDASNRLILKRVYKNSVKD
jgi:peptide/nickel transport system substrate-binding protein